MNHPLSHKIRQLVLDNIDNHNLSIEFLCKEIGISRSHLHRKIKEETTLSTALYVRKIKLEKAKELLVSTELNISEISYATGIDSPQNFSRYFVREFGVSPSIYRKLQLTEEIGGLSDVSISRSTQLEERRFGVFMVVLSAIGIISFVIIVAALTIPIFEPVKPNNSFENSMYNNGIAVLPFENIGSLDTTYLADGITEDVIAQLAKIDNLPVISKTSSYQFKNSKKSIKVIGEELNVPYVLEGAIQWQGNKIKIFTRLIRTKDDMHIWTKTIEKMGDNIYDVQSEIALDIASSLKNKIESDVIYRIRESPTKNVEAYNQVLIGRHLLRSRAGSDMEQSLTRFDQAIALDSTYADAYAFKATALYLLGDLRYRDPMESVKEAEIVALEGLKYDPENAHAYSILGSIYSRQYKWQQAESVFQIALKSNPGDALLNYWYSLVKRSLGDIPSALTYNEKAKVLDPLYPVVHAGYIATCIYGREYDKAWNQLERDSLLFIDNFVYHWAKAEYFSAREMYAQAVSQFESGLKLNPNIKSMQIGRAYAMAKLGNKSEALDIINRQSDDVPAEIHTKAVLYAGIGDFNLSLSHFLKAAANGFVASDVLVDPTYAPFVANSEYREFLKQYNFIE